MLVSILTYYIFITMVLIFSIHIYWLRGGLWPGKDKQDLLDKVIGKGFMPGKLAYFVVLFGFALMTIIPMLMYHKSNLGFNQIQNYALAFFAFIFFIRASSVFYINYVKDLAQEFVRLNKKIYAPLCLSLSISYFYLYSIY